VLETRFFVSAHNRFIVIHSLTAFLPVDQQTKRVPFYGHTQRSSCRWQWFSDSSILRSVVIKTHLTVLIYTKKG